MTRLGTLSSAALAALVFLASGCASGESQRGGESVPAPVSTTAAVTTVTPSVSMSPASDASPTASSSMTSSGSSAPAVAAREGAAAECAPSEHPSVFAFDHASGQLRWATCASEPSVPMVLGATERLVYVKVNDGAGDAPNAPASLVALDADTGAERWSVEVDPFASIPEGSLVGAGVLLTSIDGDLTAVDADDGSVHWTFPNAFSRATVATDSVVVAVDPSVPPPAPSIITIGPDGSLPPPMMGQSYSGLDRATGAKLWSTMVMVPQTSGGAPPVATIDGDVAVVDPGPSGLDVSNGAVLWTADQAPDGAPTAHGGMVVFGGQDDRRLTALDIATGEQRWTAPGRIVYDDVMAIGDSAVFAVDGDEIVSYELDSGSVRWRQPADPAQGTRPWHVAGEILFTMWWNLEARTTDTGDVLWSTEYPTQSEPVAGPRMASIATNGDVVAVGFVSGPLGGD